MLSECSPGFLGWNCTDRCPENYYGRKCSAKCSCNETQICHPVCGCLKRNSKMTTNGTNVVLENVTVSLYGEECPTTKDVLFFGTGLIYCFLVVFNSQEYFSRIWFLWITFVISFTKSNIFIYLWSQKKTQIRFRKLILLIVVLDTYLLVVHVPIYMYIGSICSTSMPNLFDNR